MSTKIADKIAALIRHADRNTDPKEAQIFMAKAQKLLRQHGLSMLDLGTLQEDQLGCTSEAGEYTAMETSFRDLAFLSARLYGCKSTISTRYKSSKGKWVKRYVINAFGRESARVTFTVMWPYIKRSTLDAAFKLYNEDKQRGRARSRSVYMREVSTALQMRIRSMLPEAKKSEGTGVNALVPVDLIDQMIEDSGATPARSVVKSTSRRAMEAANQINLSEQVQGSSVEHLQIEKS